MALWTPKSRVATRTIAQAVDDYDLLPCARVDDGQLPIAPEYSAVDHVEEAIAAECHEARPRARQRNGVLKSPRRGVDNAEVTGRIWTARAVCVEDEDLPGS